MKTDRTTSRILWIYYHNLIFSRQKINQDIVEFNSTINQLDIMNIGILLLHPEIEESHSFQTHKEHSPRETTFWATQHTLKNLKE